MLLAAEALPPVRLPGLERAARGRGAVARLDRDGGAAGLAAQLVQVDVRVVAGGRGLGVGLRDARSLEDDAHERAERRHRAGDDADAGFDPRPHDQAGEVVEVVRILRQVVDGADADERGDGGAERLVLVGWSGKAGRENALRSKRHDEVDGCPLLPSEVRVAEHEEGDSREDEVGQSADGGLDVPDTDAAGLVVAVSFLVLIPEIRGRVALEDGAEKHEQPPSGGHDQRAPDGVLLPRDDNDAKQEEADRDLDHDDSKRVEGSASEPVL